VCFGVALAALGLFEAGGLAKAAGPAAGGTAASGPAEAGPYVRAQSTTSSTTRQALTSARAILDQHCVSCHGGASPQAGLALDKLDPARVEGDAEKWEKVIAKLGARAMPPAGRPRPDEATYERLVASLATPLDAAAAARPDPGRTVIHRLNRVEYVNAIRDLLALDIDGRSLLPADDSGYGFDNIAAVLAVSPALLERYMIAAGKISRLAIGDPAMRPAMQTYSLRTTLVQEDRMGEELPFGTRGGLAVSHYFPVSGDYQFKIRLQRTHASQIRGLQEPNDIEVRIDRQRVKLFTVGGDGPRDPWSAVPSASFYEQSADDILELRVNVKAGTHLVSVAFPKKGGLQEGILEPRLSVATYEYAGDRDSAMGVATLQVSGPFGATEAGDTPSRQRIFTCKPASAADEEPCARTILTTLGRRAYRRPLTAADVDTLMKFYRSGSAGAIEPGPKGPGLQIDGRFEAGIELALRAILVDPDFLFRAERPANNDVGAGFLTAEASAKAVSRPNSTNGAAFRISQIELASRLSFFLWSSIPDDELLDVAIAGKLADRAMLERQVTRMLADRRANALVTNFGGQWLQVRNLREKAPDPGAFPEFDENLREAFQRETELFLDSQIRENRGVADLLTADYTFLNERLARHYGIPQVYGSHFRRVTLADKTRSGLLGHGSILSVTSYPNRTSPTLRGKWLLENVLGAPPPPPPPNVPSLEEASAAKPTSVRQRMEQHRANAVCASCHAPMDPLGLALENFDGIGRWRARDGNLAIDASASLPDGAAFEGPAGLRNHLMTRKSRFAQTVAEKLLTYALGRGIEYYDAPAVRRIVRDAARQDYRWSAIILGIVQSTPFQMRRS
jgi:mono/diheme cytochrome c family protein